MHKPAHVRAVAGLLVLLLAAGERLVAQVGQVPQALGALRATGDVTVNGAGVSAEQTLFAGDTLKTGPGGSAGVTLTGRGVLVAAAQTEISFAAAPRYFASLRSGTLTMRYLSGARNAQIEVSNFIVLPPGDSEGAAEVTRAADGSARVTSLAGSIGVLGLESEVSAFLRPGQTAEISAQGKLVAGAPPVTQPPGPAPAPTAGGGGRTALILVAVAGGGAAAALAALGKKKGGQAVSPSAP